MKLLAPHLRFAVSRIGSNASRSNKVVIPASSILLDSFRRDKSSGSSASSSPPSCGRKNFTTVVPHTEAHRESAQSLQIRHVLDDNELLLFDTLHEMQTRACLVFEDNPLFGTYKANADGKKEGGKFEWMTYGEYAEKVDTCRAVLKDLGVEEYSKIGIISNNRWEWATIAAAAYSMKATFVPMYEAQLPKDWTYILNDAGCMALFCATQDIYDRVRKEVLPSTPLVQATLCLDAPPGESHALATAMERAAGKKEKIIEPTEDDLANLVYTSGTTGKPKGVELTHLNFCSNVKGVRTMVSDPHDFIRQADRSLAFLPWAHSYGQTCELWCAMAHGGSMGICRGVPSILEDLQMVKPSVLFAVPTLYKKVYDGVNNTMENSPPLRKKLMRKALELGRRRILAERGVGPPMGVLEQIQFKILDGIVLQKIRDRFGGNLRHGFVAGAATPREVLDFMDNIGIEICEGYGLTETSPIIALNSPEHRRVGSVGRALGGVSVVIMGEDGKPVDSGQEGEVCCYGPNVMRGYYKNQEATDEVITVASDGKSRLFHTGDLGRTDEDGFIYITGRLKEQYKLENGKYVCPTPIEEAISLSRFINQVVVCGANRPYNVALIVPDWPSIRAELKVGDDVSEDDLVNDERVRSLIDSEIQSMCKSIKKFEVPTAWTFVAPFTAANNMLTPKMSIRRHMVIRTYEDAISHMYGDDPIVTESADGAHHKEEVA